MSEGRGERERERTEGERREGERERQGREETEGWGGVGWVSARALVVAPRSGGDAIEATYFSFYKVLKTRPAGRTTPLSGHTLDAASVSNNKQENVNSLLCNHVRVGDTHTHAHTHARTQGHTRECKHIIVVLFLSRSLSLGLCASVPF